MKIDVDALSQAQREKVARTSRRSAKSEAVAIASAGASAIAMALFVFAFDIVLWVSLYFGTSSSLSWISFSFLVAGVLALIHFRVATRKIEKAKLVHAAVLYAQEKREREEQSARFAEMSAEVGAK